MEKEILLGYVIMRNSKFKVGTNTPDGMKWEPIESGFRIEYMKKRIYPYKESAEEAVVQLSKCYKEDEFEVHPVYWHGRK